MGLIEKIAQELGVDAEISANVKYTVFDGHSAYVEGIKGIISYSPEEIIFQLKSGTLILSGVSLSIKKLCMGDAAVLGSITSVRKER